MHHNFLLYKRLLRKQLVKVIFIYVLVQLFLKLYHLSYFQTLFLFFPISRFMCRRVMAALGRAYFFSMGFRVVVKGKQVGSSEAPILAVAPHSTFFDGIVCIVAGLPSTVSRVENLATPIFGSETLFSCFRTGTLGCRCKMCSYCTSSNP